MDSALGDEASRFQVAAAAFIGTHTSPGTRAAYSANLARWLDYCEQAGADPASPTTEAATAFRDALIAKPLMPATVRQILASLSGTYRRLAAGERPAASWNPFHPDALPWPAAAAFSPTEAIPDAVAEQMIDAAEADPTPAGKRDAAVLHLLSATGLRRSSIVSMRRAQLRRDGDCLVVTVTVKGGKPAEVVVPERAAAAVERWLAAAPDSPHIFPGRDPRAPMCVDMVNRIVLARGREVGHEGAHPHSFRAALVTRALDAGLPLHEVQAAVHHLDPKTTLRYDRGTRGMGVTAAVEEFRKGKRNG